MRRYINQKKGNKSKKRGEKRRKRVGLNKQAK